MPRTLATFWQEGFTFSWKCPRCHKQNHIRAIDDADLFGDKCHCELYDTVYKQRTLDVMGIQIRYLGTYSENEIRN